MNAEWLFLLLNVLAVSALLRGGLLFRIVAGDAPYQFPTTAAAPPQWLRGPQRHAPPHMTCPPPCDAPCMPWSCPALHASPHHKLLWGLLGCGDGSLAMVMTVWLLGGMLGAMRSRHPNAGTCPFPLYKIQNMYLRAALSALCIGS